MQVANNALRHYGPRPDFASKVSDFFQGRHTRNLVSDQKERATPSLTLMDSLLLCYNPVRFPQLYDGVLLGWFAILVLQGRKGTDFPQPTYRMIDPIAPMNFLYAYGYDNTCGYNVYCYGGRTSYPGGHGIILAQSPAPHVYCPATFGDVDANCCPVSIFFSAQLISENTGSFAHTRTSWITVAVVSINPPACSAAYKPAM